MLPTAHPLLKEIIHPSAISIPSIELDKNVHVVDENPGWPLTPLKIDMMENPILKK